MKPLLKSKLPRNLVESMGSFGYSLPASVADIIDNSISADCSNIWIKFLWNNGSPWLAIIDDGRGMNRTELEDALCFAGKSSSEKRSKSDLGRFSLGLKTASISQCKHLTVAVKSKEDSLSIGEWNLEEEGEDPDYISSSILETEDLDADCFLNSFLKQEFETIPSGCLVLWRSLDLSIVGDGRSADERRFSEKMNLVHLHLERTFHRFLNPERGFSTKNMYFNNTQITGFDPFGPSNNPARVELPSQKIRLQGEEIKIQPYILPHRSKVSEPEYKKYAGEEGYLQNQGFYIYRNRRLIQHSTWFRLIKKEELNKLIRVRVDIPNSLDELWKIDVRKSLAQPPESVRNQFKTVINRIEGAGKMVFKKRAAKISSKNIVSIWSREIIEGKIQYKVNEEFPLLKDIIEKSEKDFSKKIKMCLDQINHCFPYDLYFSDAADDTTDFVDTETNEDQIRSTIEKLVEIFAAQGFTRDQIRRKIEETDIHGINSKLIKEVVNN